MCEFCIQHGAGKKWYLAAKNYADELARSDGRESFIKDFFENLQTLLVFGAPKIYEFSSVMKEITEEKYVRLK